MTEAAVSVQTSETATSDDQQESLFTSSLRMVGEKIPAQALAWLWTIHAMHGDKTCPAHAAGEKCCIDALLEAAPNIDADSAGGALGLIIRAGYDMHIEADDDARTGTVSLYMTYEEQADINELHFTGTAATLDQVVDKGRAYAVAFPRGAHK